MGAGQSYEQIDEAVDVFLQRMGLEGHQVIYALHKNTGHCHVHIVVNRTHPDTLKVIQPHKGFDIEEAHTRPEVANEMYRNARPLRKEKESRDWRNYAARAVWYAFGVAGDIDIAAFEPTPGKILSFHQEAEKLEAERQGETMRESIPEAPKMRMR